MKRVSDTGKPVVAIPVVGVAVDVHVPLVVPTVERSVALYDTPSVPLPIEYSPSCIEFGICNALAYRTKYFHFLKFAYCTLFQAMTENTLTDMKTGFGSGKP
tara:strand:- start:810 stop:1115 length:306 start_codon:yes stop_codon:yes gene_type:complete